MKTPILIDRLIQQFGVAVDSTFYAEIESCGLTIDELIVHPVNEDGYKETFEVRDFPKQGLRLCFSDYEFYFAAGSALYMPPMIFSGICIYNGAERYNMDAYQSIMPLGLDWFDPIDNVIKKINEPNWLHKYDGGAIARFDRDDHFLNCFFDINDNLEHIEICLDVPRPSAHHVKRSSQLPTSNQLVNALGKQFNSSEVEIAFSGFELLEMFDDEPHEGIIEHRRIVDSGIEISFNFHSAADVAVRAIRLFRRGDALSWGYQGALPFNLNFDDAPETILRKIGHEPYACQFDEFSGYFLWRFNNYILHINISILEARINRLVLYQLNSE